MMTPPAYIRSATDRPFIHRGASQGKTNIDLIKPECSSFLTVALEREKPKERKLKRTIGYRYSDKREIVNCLLRQSARHLVNINCQSAAAKWSRIKRESIFALRMMRFFVQRNNMLRGIPLKASC